MATEHIQHARRPLLRGMVTVAIAGTLVGCDLIPGGGYQVVTDRRREPIPVAAAPAPPPVVAGIGGSGGGEVPQLAANAPAGVTQAMVEEGAQLYGTTCSACHGAGGQGTPAAPSLNDPDWLNISGNYDEIVNVIHSGVPNPRQYPGGMPPLGGGNFNEEQVRQLAAYVFALSHQQGS